MCRDAYFVPQKLILRNHPHEKVVIAKSGTDNINDWFTNFTFKKNKDGAHSGFYNAAASTIEHSNLRKVINDPLVRDVTFGGHSSGAATVLMMAYMLREELMAKRRVDVYMFGSPKAGGDPFTETVENMLLDHEGRMRVYNISNGNDPVPRMPANFPSGFVHPSPILDLVAASDESPLENHFTTSYIRSLAECVRDKRSIACEGRCLMGDNGCRHIQL